MCGRGALPTPTCKVRYYMKLPGRAQPHKLNDQAANGQCAREQADPSSRASLEPKPPKGLALIINPTGAHPKHAFEILLRHLRR